MKRPEQLDKQQQSYFRSVTIKWEHSFYTVVSDNHSGILQLGT